MDKDNFFKNMEDMQKSFFDYYMNITKGFGENLSGPFSRNPFDRYQDFFKDFLSQDMFSYSGSPSELINKMNKANEVYYKVYELYKNLYKDNVAPSVEHAKSVYEDFKNQTKDYMNKFFMPFMPEGMRDIINRTEAVFNSYKDTMDKIYGPWNETFKDFYDSFMSGVLKDPEEFLKYFDIWQKNYNETFGKLLNMPTMGIDRNAYRDKLQTFDKFIKFLANSAELNLKLSAIINDSTKSVIDDVVKLSQEGKNIKDFEEFYNFFKVKLSDNFDNVFYSDEFAKFLGNYLDSMLTLKIDIDKVIEDSLKYYPIPTNTDMKSLYKTVYELKKEVRTLKREKRTLVNKFGGYEDFSNRLAELENSNAKYAKEIEELKQKLESYEKKSIKTESKTTKKKNSDK